MIGIQLEVENMILYSLNYIQVDILKFKIINIIFDYMYIFNRKIIFKNSLKSL